MDSLLQLAFKNVMSALKLGASTTDTGWRAQMFKWHSGFAHLLVNGVGLVRSGGEASSGSSTAQLMLYSDVPALGRVTAACSAAAAELLPAFSAQLALGLGLSDLLDPAGPPLLARLLRCSAAAEFSWCTGLWRCVSLFKETFPELVEYAGGDEYRSLLEV